MTPELLCIGGKTFRIEGNRAVPYAGTVSRPRQPPCHHEEDAQRALFAWVDELAVLVEPRLGWLFHIPNGGRRSKATAGRLKAMGVRAGVPDLCLPIPAQGYHGVYLELKDKGRIPSTDQAAWIAGLTGVGYSTGVYDDWTAAARHLCAYLDRPDLVALLPTR